MNTASQSEAPTQPADLITQVQLEHARLKITLDNIPVGLVVADALSGKIVLGQRGS